ncbi:hypothetical protein C6A87_019275 [Mycobacterium sp. ITM-2016-00317]|uniref:hypothetical protein n=1 Tax=Mycobacterium sp. ITM-2016-00317 TaxID=2099694 RepID=UPI000D4AC84E|nr:hypothetical protein [Mycobacterium sp. ITM-2016-00317]WNG86028.1 hypothetical protein C6A87_019275 [Mycobacterium sp. ITM-2016-00317]
MAALKYAALAFAVLALTAGVLQIAAYASGGWLRHLIVGVFACAVGCSVGAAAVAAIVKSRR